jgi:predicted amidohydrolase YtcJ
VVFSSDGMPPGPLYGIKGATHHAVEGQSIGVVDAYRRYMTAADAPWNGADNAAPIEAGARADFVVLSGNPLIADPDRLRVEATFAGGAEVFRSPLTDPRHHSKHGL